MARKRMIDPKFWSDDKIIELEPLSRLCFIGLWNFSDDFGIHKFNAKVIKAEIFPADDIPLAQVELMLEDLVKLNLIEVSEDEILLRIKGWNIYQKINRPQPSKYEDVFHLKQIDKKESPKEKSIKKPVVKSKSTIKPYKQKVDEFYKSLDDEFIKDLKEAYPNVDINQQLKESRLWLIANTNKAKKNFQAFITRWMGKCMEQNSYNNNSTISVKKIKEQNEADLREEQMQREDEEYREYLKENSKNSATPSEINEYVKNFKNKNKEKLNAAINPENIKN